MPTHRTGRIFEGLKIRAFSCPVHTEPTLPFENSRLAVLRPAWTRRNYWSRVNSVRPNLQIFNRSKIRPVLCFNRFFWWVRIIASGRKKDGTPSMQKTHQKAIIFQNGVDLRHKKWTNNVNCGAFHLVSLNLTPLILMVWTIIGAYTCYPENLRSNSWIK